MAKAYIHGNKIRHHSRFARASIIILIGLVVIGAIFGVREYHQLQKPTTQINNTQSAAKNGYINTYFIFSDDVGWQIDQKDTTANQISYSKYQNGKLVQKLSAYINTNPDLSLLGINHILQVSVADNENINATDITSPCDTGDTIQLKNLKLNCPNFTNYAVLLAQSDGTYQLSLTRNHQTTPMTFVFYDYTAAPDPDAIIKVANTIKAN